MYNPNGSRLIDQERYPNYDPLHWYLSVIKPKQSSRKTHIVAIRELMAKPRQIQLLDDEQSVYYYILAISLNNKKEEQNAE